MNYEAIQKCVSQVEKKYKNISKKDLQIITDDAIMEKRGPASIFIIDLLRRIPDVRPSKLSLEQKSEYRAILRDMRRNLAQPATAKNPPGSVLWDWWDPEESPMPEFLEILIWRTTKPKKTKIELSLRDKEYGRLHKDEVLTTDTRANNLIRFLLLKDVEIFT